MPPIEHAIIGGVLCWRYVQSDTPWRACDPSSLTNEIVALRAQVGLAPYPVLEDGECMGWLD